MGHLCNRYLNDGRDDRDADALHAAAAPAPAAARAGCRTSWPPHRAPRVTADRRVRGASPPSAPARGTASTRSDSSEPARHHPYPRARISSCLTTRRNHEAQEDRSSRDGSSLTLRRWARAAREAGRCVRGRLPVRGHWSGRSRSVRVAATTSWRGRWSTSCRRDELYTENIRDREPRRRLAAPPDGATCCGKAGEGYGISTTSGSFITTPLQADTGWAPTDFTPVGLLAADNALLIGSGDSGLQDVGRVGRLRQGEELGRRWAASAPSTSTTSCTQMMADADGLRDRVRAVRRGGPDADLARSPGAIEAMISNPGSIVGQVEARAR